MKIVSALAVAIVAGAANAAVVTIGPFGLDGSQEVGAPAQILTGSGTATLTLDTATGAFSLAYSFSGLTGTVTVAHFHQAAAGVNGPVVYWLAANGAPNNLPTTLMNPALPGGVTSATGVGTGTFSAGLVNAALAGNLYINIHSTARGAGEIRGQVVPTPGALALVGVAGLVGLRRRRSA